MLQQIEEQIISKIDEINDTVSTFDKLKQELKELKLSLTKERESFLDFKKGQKIELNKDLMGFAIGNFQFHHITEIEIVNITEKFITFIYSKGYLYKKEKVGNGYSIVRKGRNSRMSKQNFYNLIVYKSILGKLIKRTSNLDYLLDITK